MRTQKVIGFIIAILLLLIVIGIAYYQSSKTTVKKTTKESPSTLPYYDQLSPDGNDYDGKYYRPQYFKHRRMRVNSGNDVMMSSQNQDAYGNMADTLHYDKSCMYA